MRSDAGASRSGDGSRSRVEPITRATNRGEWIARARLRELATQPRDVRFDQIRLCAEVVAPHLLFDLGAGEQPAGVDHEIFEDSELLGAQRNLVAVDGGDARRCVETDASPLDDGRMRRRMAASQGAKARQ